RHAHQPAQSLHHEVVARAIAVGAGLPEAGDGAVDEARMLARQRRVVETVARKVAYLEVLHQYVALQRERTGDATPFGPGDVERERFLAAIAGKVVRGIGGIASLRVLEKGRAPVARVVAPSRTLDLDHFGAEVGEELRGPGTGQYAGQVE